MARVADGSTEVRVLEALRGFVVELVRAELAARSKEREADEYLSTRRAAAIAEVTPRTIRRWLRAKKMKRYGGTQLRISRKELDAFFRRGGLAESQLLPAERARLRFGQ